jgi:hypothetical protein
VRRPCGASWHTQVLTTPRAGTPSELLHTCRAVCAAPPPHQPTPFFVGGLFAIILLCLAVVLGIYAVLAEANRGRDR